MKQNYITKDDVTAAREMRAKEIGWGEIAEKLDKPLKTLQQRFYADNKVNAPVKKKVILKKHKVSTDVPQAARPMIALVGTPSEVTSTIKELFS